MCPAGEAGEAVVSRAFLLIVTVFLIVACGNASGVSTHVAQSSPSAPGQSSAVVSAQPNGCTSNCQQAAAPASPPPSTRAAALGCGTYCQQAGGSAGNGPPPGYPCTSTGCLQCPSQNCVTLQSSSATATNGVATVQLTCNLSTNCTGAFLICLVNTFCYPGPTYGSVSGGRLGASDFVVPAGTTSNVQIGLTDLGNQVATGPSGYDAQVIVDMLDYGYVITANSGFDLTSTDPPVYPQGATASCGGTVFVGPGTACSFAESVANAYENNNDSGNVTMTATDPATGETYTIQCSGQSPVSCTEGTNALVVFYS
jgi:hypothetical protein